jgi:hypothetical protein
MGGRLWGGMMNKECISYTIRLLFLIIVVVICRYIYPTDKYDFYNYISYIYSIGLLLIIILPNLHEFSFLGIKGKVKDVDNTDDMIVLEEK